VALIFFFLLREGLPTFGEVELPRFSSRWYPIEDYYGILPLITGSIIITFGAALIAVPFWHWHRRLYFRDRAALDA
jgi:phosphate transport system permease protein